MRIFNKENRLNTSLKTINYFFENEYNYYSNKNIRSFIFEGSTYKSLYKRINIQLLITKKCPYNCSFCIEKQNNVGKNDNNEILQFKNLKKLLLILKNEGLEPTVSITGGEPMLYPIFVKEVKNMLDDLNVISNLNTSGLLGNKLIDKALSTFNRINLSVHHYDAYENSKVFNVPRDNYWENYDLFNIERTTIQSVLNNNNIAYLINFLESFKNKRFSIRFPSLTSEDSSIEWFNLFQKINNDDRFKFVQQKIGDYYWYEEYLFHDEKQNKDKIIHFSFSSITQLEYYKENIEKENNFVRAIIVLPNGDIKFDWI